MNTKTTIVLALLVVVGGILLVLERPWEDATRRETEQTEADQTGRPQNVITEDIAAADFTRVELVVGREQPIVAERDDPGWKLVAPLQTMAEPWLPNNIIRRCLDLKYTKKFAPGDDGAPSREEAGLDDAQVTVTLHRADDQPPMVVRFGRQAPLSNHHYAALDDRPDIYVVTADVRRNFKRTLDEFRSKKIFSFDADDVKSMAVAGAHEYELKRDENNEWMIDKPVRAKANRARPASLVTTLRNLRAKDFADDTPNDLRPYGLDAPRWTIALIVEKTIEPTESVEDQSGDQPEPDGSQPPESIAEPQIERTEFALLIGGPAGDNHFAKLADQPWVFTIPDTTLTSLTPALLELRDKVLCEFDRNQVEKIELQVAGQGETLTRGGDDWMLDSGERAEPIAVDDLLKTLENLEAASFEDRPPLVDTGLDDPRATITLTITGRDMPVRLTVGNPTASGKMVYTRSGDEPTIAILRDETVMPMLTPPIGYRDRQILDFNKSRVGEIEITRDNTSYVVTESFGNWQMTSPVEAPADKEVVENMLADLNSLRARRVVASGSGAEFGLDDPWVAVTVRLRSEESDPTEDEATEPVETTPEFYSLRVAATPDGKIYARHENGQFVYEIDHLVLDNLLAELHDRRAIPIDRQTYAAKITYRITDRAFTLEKVGKDKWIADVDSVLPIDPEKVSDAFGELCDLRTGKFINYRAEELAEYGLDKPAIELTVVDDFGEVATMLVSATGPEQDPERSRYATVAGSNKVYLLPLDSLGVLNKTLTDFEMTAE